MTAGLSPTDSGWRGWLLAVGLSAAMHAGMLWGYMGGLDAPQFRIAQQISVTLIQQAEQRTQSSPSAETIPEATDKKAVSKPPVPHPVARPAFKPTPKPTPKPRKAVAEAEQPRSHAQNRQQKNPALAKDPHRDRQAPAEQKSSAGQPMPQIREADYSADYLNNPLPHYPKAARRRHIEGLVLLHVEVLATGRCGRIGILQSSGHALLDDAAVAAVKQWRFVPARRAGIPIDHWLHIPIRFRLTRSD